MRKASKNIKLSLTPFSKFQVDITMKQQKMILRSSTNRFGEKFGHLVKVSNIAYATPTKSALISDGQPNVSFLWLFPPPPPGLKPKL